MADRKMTLQEKLAAARAGGPAKPEGEADREVSPPEVTPPAEPADVPASPAPIAAAPQPSELGRPLTLKEKLAAARAGAVPPSPAAAAAAPTVAAEASASEAGSVAEPAVPPPSPSELGRPLTLQEKLAAARGGKAPAGGAAPAPGAKPAAAKPAPAAAQAASTRPLPSLEKTDDPKDLAEHLRRAGVAKEQASKAAVAAASPAPSKPARRAESKVVPPRPGREAATSAARPGPTRRQFYRGVVVGTLSSWFFWGWATFAAANVAFLTACARFMFPNVLAEPPSTIKVGLPGNFEKGEVNERWKAEWGFWIVRSDYYDGMDKLYALSTICTHLGCPPNWLAGEQKFKCPCHGSGYYISGVNFEGPAPRPLERFKVSVGDDGQIVVDKSRKFQQELGQWDDPDSYVQS